MINNPSSAVGLSDSLGPIAVFIGLTLAVYQPTCLASLVVVTEASPVSEYP
jgi:hypothetical protein